MLLVDSCLCVCGSDTRSSATPGSLLSSCFLTSQVVITVWCFLSSILRHLLNGQLIQLLINWSTKSSCDCSLCFLVAWISSSIKEQLAYLVHRVHIPRLQQMNDALLELGDVLQSLRDLHFLCHEVKSDEERIKVTDNVYM